jgi:hypothetical protein
MYDAARGQRPSPHRVGAVAALELALDTLPAPLAAVIQTAVAIDPDRRFATAGEMGAAIRDAGRALGGSLDRGALARWLAARFGAAIEARRAAIAASPARDEPSTVTQRFELHSLVFDAVGDPDEPVAVADAPPTAELPPPPALIREREHPAIGEVQALVAAQDASRPQPARRARPIFAFVAVAIALVVVLGAGSMARRRSRQSHVSEPRTAMAQPDAGPPDAEQPDAPEPPAEAASVVEPQPRPAPAPAPPARKASARLSIDSDPFAVIELDGKPLGTTPLYQLPVPPGRHALRAETGDGRVQRRAIDLAPGAKSSIRLRWPPSPPGASP